MSVAQIASWSPVTTTAFIWAPPESFVDTLPAFSLMLRRCPATYNEHHISPRPHQPLLGWYECRLYSPRRAGRERGERAAYAGSDPAAASLCPIRRGAVRCSRTRRDFRGHGISDNAGFDCSAVVRARTLLQGAIGVGSGVARLHRLPLLPALDRVHDDPGPEADDHDASDHLTGNQQTSRLGHGRNITEPDG